MKRHLPHHLACCCKQHNGGTGDWRFPRFEDGRTLCSGCIGCFGFEAWSDWTLGSSPKTRAISRLNEVKLRFIWLDLSCLPFSNSLHRYFFFRNPLWNVRYCKLSPIPVSPRTYPPCWGIRCVLCYSFSLGRWNRWFEKALFWSSLMSKNHSCHQFHDEVKNSTSTTYKKCWQFLILGLKAVSSNVSRGWMVFFRGFLKEGVTVTHFELRKPNRS